MPMQHSIHLSIPRKRALGATGVIRIWLGPISYNEDVARILIRSLDLNPFRDTLIYCRSTPVTECPISARQTAVTQTHITHSKNSNVHNNRLKA